MLKKYILALLIIGLAVPSSATAGLGLRHAAQSRFLWGSLAAAYTIDMLNRHFLNSKSECELAYDFEIKDHEYNNGILNVLNLKKENLDPRRSGIYQYFGVNYAQLKQLKQLQSQHPIKSCMSSSSGYINLNQFFESPVHKIYAAVENIWQLSYDGDDQRHKKIASNMLDIREGIYGIFMHNKTKCFATLAPAICLLGYDNIKCLLTLGKHKPMVCQGFMSAGLAYGLYKNPWMFSKTYNSIKSIFIKRT